jgi:hypothetical protein
LLKHPAFAQKTTRQPAIINLFVIPQPHRVTKNFRCKTDMFFPQTSWPKPFGGASHVVSGIKWPMFRVDLMYIQHKNWVIICGWWFQPLWKILVSWDDYSQYMEKQKNLPNHQSVICFVLTTWCCFILPNNMILT